MMTDIHNQLHAYLHVITTACRDLLQELSMNNQVTLAWVQGHSDIAGNEIADKLAREESDEDPIGATPHIPLSNGWVRNTIYNWSVARHSNVWRSSTNCRQTKLIVHEPLKASETKKILSLNRPILRKLIGVLTGHFFFNYHLFNMGCSNTTLCPRCEADMDTAYHLVSTCPVYATRRNRVLGDFVLSQEQYSKLSLWQIKEFISKIAIDEQHRRP
jgi:hypothetical protein